jgi:hypothetical protein
MKEGSWGANSCLEGTITVNPSDETTPNPSAGAAGSISITDPHPVRSLITGPDLGEFTQISTGC